GERSAAATLAAWQQYRRACELRLRHDPPAPGEHSGVGERQAWLLEQFRLVYTVGYSVSLVSLLLALLLLLLFRLSYPGVGVTKNWGYPQHRAGPTPLSPLSPQAVAGCRLAQALMQYCVGANYGWLLAEGLFLHKLLVLATFSGDRCLPAFLLLGWGEVSPCPHVPMSP
ncbi:hypothetical protein ASZ78_012814, partial [Callipepla squamata]